MAVMRRYIVIDGFKYAVSTGTYIRKWLRSFTSQLVANIVRLNFIDNGPGVRVYSMTLQLETWPPTSDVYKDGVTQTIDQQLANLESSYGKAASSLQFFDPFGNPPSAGSGVYFTNYNQIIPNYGSVNKTFVLAEVELTESTQVVA